MLKQEMTELVARREEHIRLLRCDPLPKGQWIEATLRNEAWKRNVAFSVCKTPLSVRDPTGWIRIQSMLNADMLQILVRCFRIGTPIPNVRYVLVGIGPGKELSLKQNRMMQVQASKHGWELCYLDSEQPIETVKARISQIFNPYISHNERILNTMKETKIIIDALSKTESKELSLKENMVRYCIDVEHYTEEEAVKVVEAIIKGTSEFTSSFDNVKGRTKAEVAATLKDRLDEKLKELPGEDADKILENLYVEMMAFGSDKLAEIASEISDENMKEAIKDIRRNCSATLEGKSYDEKLELIASAIENCGSMSALMALAEDERSFSSARCLDDTISTATLNSTENLHVLDEYALIRTKNYTALAEYISAQHGHSRRYSAETTPYEVGVSTAASIENRRIRLAALAGMITFDNAVKLLAAVAMIALALLVAYLSIYFSIGLFFGSLIAGYPILAAALATGGVLLTYEGVQLVIRNKDKVGAVVAAPVIWIKNLAVRLIRGFCRIFNIKLSTNNPIMNEEMEEEAESVDTEAAEATEREEAEEEQSTVNATEAPNFNRHMAHQMMT